MVVGEPVVTETVVYLIRHTEPVLPDGRPRFTGQADPPLSPSGIDRARLLAERLQGIHFDAAYSSDLQRCLQTAEIIASASLPRIRPDRRLREIDTGLWQGLTFEEAHRRYPLEHAERELDLVGYRFPGGESFRDLRERVIPAFLEIVERGGGNILISGHRGVNRVLLSEFLGMPLEKLFSIRQDYGCVNLIKVARMPDASRHFEVTALPTSESGATPSL